MWRAMLLELRRAQTASHEPLVAICDAWIDSHEQVDGRFHLLKAGILLSAGRIEDAMNEGRLAARRGASSLDVLQSMFDLLDQLQLHDETIELTRAARASFPDEQQVTAILVHRLWRVGAFDKAQAELARHAADARGIELVRWQVLLSIASNDDEGTERALHSLVALAESVEAQEQVGVLAWADAVRANRNLDWSTWLDSVQACRNAIALSPQDAILHNLVGQAYAYVGEHALAADSFERAAALDDHWVAPRIARASSLLAAGRGQEALAVAVAMFRSGQSFPLDGYVVLARAWLTAGPRDGLGLIDPETGRTIDLVALLQDIYERSGQDSRFAVLLVEAYATTGRRAAAVDLIDEFRVRPAVSAATLLDLADASARRGFGLEQSLVERALEIAGPTPQIVGIQAELLRRQGRIDEGLRLIEKTFGQGPGGTEYTLAAMQMRAAYLARARHPMATQALTELLAADEASITAASMVLQQPIAWENRELISQAIERLGTIVGERTRKFRHARAEYVLRFESDNAATLASATALISQDLIRDPESLPALTLMSRLMLAGESPDLDLGVRHLRRAVDLYPYLVQLYPRLISLLQQQGDYSSAAEYLQRFGSQTELPPQLRRVEVGLLQGQGDVSTALVRLATMVDESSSESDLLALALLQSRAGEYDDAQRTYERLLAAPDRSSTLFKAAAGFYASTGRLDEALALLDAPELQSTPGVRALLLGGVHQEYGDLVQATAFLQAAVAAAPDRAETWVALARHWLLRGDTDQARRTAASGLQAHPDDTVLQKHTGHGEPRRRRGCPCQPGCRSMKPCRRWSRSMLGRPTSQESSCRKAGISPMRGSCCRTFHSFVRPGTWRFSCTVRPGAPRRASRLPVRLQTAFRQMPPPARWAVELLLDAGRRDEALRNGLRLAATLTGRSACRGQRHRVAPAWIEASRRPPSGNWLPTRIESSPRRIAWRTIWWSGSGPCWSRGGTLRPLRSLRR